jgi:PGF-CTERM protein
VGTTGAPTVRTVGTTGAPDGEDGAADGSGPGFGVLGGLAGLGAAAGYAYRRIGADSDEE